MTNEEIDSSRLRYQLQPRFFNIERKRMVWGIIFVSPILLFLAAFMLYPIISVFAYSFTSWDGMHSIKFVGLENYSKIFQSRDFWTVIKNNLYFLVVGVPVWTIFPLVIGIILYEEIKGFNFFRTSFLLPTVLSAAVVGILFRAFFDYNGPINIILRSLGLDFLAIQWLASGTTSIPIIIIAINWAGFGSAVLIFLAGMASISPSIYESSYLDGANWFQRLWYVTLPMINNVTQFVIVLNIISAFTSLFSYVFVVTNGGPGYESTVIEYLIYLKAFRSNQFGYACALAVILFLIVLIISRLQMKAFLKPEDWRE